MNELLARRIWGLPRKAFLPHMDPFSADHHWLPYQRAWLCDPSRFKIGLWARQTGKDHTASGEAVLDCLHNPGANWVILAVGERQALETYRKAVEWAGIYRLPIRETEEKRKRPETRLTASRIEFVNGSRISALPARPQTVRGYSANLILTEFAFHEQADAIWRAIYPAISNPARGGRKVVRIITTPNGRGNLFHALWQDRSYSKHKVTLQDAVRAGLPIDMEELRRGLHDPEAWAQEYECEFMDNSAVLLPYELIEECESEEATTCCAPEDLAREKGALFAGIDFGRKRDLTVCWVLERVGEVLWTREVLALRKMATPEQVTALAPRLARVQRVCLDYTGAGVGLGDELVRRFGEWKPVKHMNGKMELCSFTAGLKTELFPRLRVAFEAKQLRIPVDREIREDLHGVHRVISAHGNISYRATLNDDGHSDRCTALALALRAAQAATVASGISVLREEERPFPRRDVFERRAGAGWNAGR